MYLQVKSRDAKRPGQRIGENRERVRAASSVISLTAGRVRSLAEATESLGFGADPLCCVRNGAGMVLRTTRFESDRASRGVRPGTPRHQGGTSSAWLGPDPTGPQHPRPRCGRCASSRPGQGRGRYTRGEGNAPIQLWVAVNVRAMPQEVAGGRAGEEPAPKGRRPPVPVACARGSHRGPSGRRALACRRTSGRPGCAR